MPFVTALVACSAAGVVSLKVQTGSFPLQPQCVCFGRLSLCSNVEQFLFFGDYSAFSVAQHQVLLMGLEKVTLSPDKSLGSNLSSLVVVADRY